MVWLRRPLLYGLLLAVSISVPAKGSIYVLPSGHAIDQDGNVIAEGLEVSGEQRDQVRGREGQLYRADSLQRNADGQLVGPDGKPVRRGNATSSGSQPQVSNTASVTEQDNPPPYTGPGVKMIVGGQSEEGVAKITTLPILK